MILQHSHSISVFTAKISNTFIFMLAATPKQAVAVERKGDEQRGRGDLCELDLQTDCKKHTGLLPLLHAGLGQEMGVIVVWGDG